MWSQFNHIRHQGLTDLCMGSSYLAELSCRSSPEESIMSMSGTHCVIHSHSMNFHFNVISLLTSRFKRVWKSKRQSEKNKNETFIDQSHHNLCTSAKLLRWGQSFCFFMELNIILSFNTLQQSWTSWDVSGNPLRNDSLGLFLAWWHNLVTLVFIFPQWTSRHTWLGAVNLTEHLWSVFDPKKENVFCLNFPLLSAFILHCNIILITIKYFLHIFQYHFLSCKTSTNVQL